MEAHLGRDRLFSIVRHEFYGVSKENVSPIIKNCEPCMQENLFATKPHITPIFSAQPRDRYIADLVDLSAYKKLNENYTFVLTMVDCYSNSDGLEC